MYDFLQHLRLSFGLSTGTYQTDLERTIHSRIMSSNLRPFPESKTEASNYVNSSKFNTEPKGHQTEITGKCKVESRSNPTLIHETVGI
jgi:hypothetical protein